MSFSMYTVSPASLHDLNGHSKSCIPPPRHIDGQTRQPHNAPVTPESNFLSPYSSHVRSNLTSPALNSNTPADIGSIAEVYSTGSVYPGVDDLEDPFLGANFDDIPENWPVVNQAPANANHHATYPLSPRPTPSIAATQFFGSVIPTTLGVQVSKHPPAQPQPSINSVTSSLTDLQSTLHITGPGGGSTNKSPDPVALTMATQSPRVMVSMWGKGDDAPIQGVERSFTPGRESSRMAPSFYSIAGDLANEKAYANLSHIARDTRGDWMPNKLSGHRGLAPDERPQRLVPSPNQQEAQRHRDEKNRDVDAWLAGSTGNFDGLIGVGGQVSDPKFENDREYDGYNIPDGEIPFGDTTRNNYVNGQAYFVVDGPGGPLTSTDRDYMQYRPWEDPPILHDIQNTHCQPETSQAAIERFQRQCQDNASIISKAATWGTRRRSLPSIADIEEITTGNILKKLSISGHSRRPSLLKRVASISRKTSISYRKRKGSSASEQPPDELGDPVDRREPKDSHTASSRTSSWVLNAINKKQPYPNVSDAVLAISTGVATIGTQHASPTPIASPKSSFVPFNMRRSRSKTELPRSSSTESSHPNIVELLKGQGGPPVAQLARTQPQSCVEDDDDDDEDDDDCMDKHNSNEDHGGEKIIEPTLDGFKAHILACNPGLAIPDRAGKSNGFLVKRMAQQLLDRFHQLLTAKQNHLRLANQGRCPSGHFCRSIGDTIQYFDNRGVDRRANQLSAKALSPDEENIPSEGRISAERFPRGIILPPAISLPAEFECPLCYTVKKFLKPSDWTKHVHEDVQPFTCTWGDCREPKMFKRKADWVRHENEGHRQLECWACDVDDCRHVCYRRDNFLQHLVREHKYPEPKIKTKAAIKKASTVDRTWQKVDQCHQESTKKPSEEPCCFCGKTLTTWKKLTVHLAKHMEQISLPISGLVTKMELDLNSFIGPAQGTSICHSGSHLSPNPSIKPDPQDFSPRVLQTSTSASIVGYSSSPNMLGLSPIPQVPMSNPLYTQQQSGPQYHEMSSEANDFMMQAQYNSQQYHGLAVSTAAFGHPGAPYSLGLTVTDTECLSAFDPLGIQNTAEGISLQGLGMGNLIAHNTEPYGVNQKSLSQYPQHAYPNRNGQYYHP
ncbi:hypothetical protein GGS21DRAFT_319303 [Xylaria nigripes]|nr:hypothetical protein GGS21DRAFT_319303 [Xylaria nigripes]